jgi:phospholipid-binding lipoprotein MlaA
MKSIGRFSLVRALLLAAVISGFAGCAAQPEPAYTTPKRTFEPVAKAMEARPDQGKKSMLAVKDPFEMFNRSMYNFNARFDRLVFLPVVSGYKKVMPDVAEAGVTHFFNNLSELRNLTNNLLQGEMVDSGVTISRFAVNTTVGVLGVWDPATRWGLFEREEDFGQTLGYWGIGHGPYLVLPFFGPSSLRDAGGVGV